MQETQRMWVLSLSREDSLEEEMATGSSILAWKMDRGPWWATFHGAAQNWTWLSTHTHMHTHTPIQPHDRTKACPFPEALQYFSWGYITFLPLHSRLGPSYFGAILKTGWRNEWGSDGVWLLFTKSSLEMDLWPLHPGVKSNSLRNPTEVGYV